MSNVIISSIIPPGIATRATGVGTRAVDPNNTVRIYAQPSCAGEVVGEGPVHEFEAAGVPLFEPVAPNSSTTFYANQSDAVGPPSPCSANGLTYRHVTEPPEPPTFAATAPVSPANSNSPRLIGNADSDAVVWIYAGAACAGEPVAAGTGAEFQGPGIAVDVADNSESTFSATAEMAGFESGCGAEPISFVEVTPPPDPGGEPGDGGETPGGGGNGAGQGGGGGVSPGVPVSPPVPPRLRTVPGGWANDNTPLIAGSAPGAEVVRIYADEKCGGPVVARGSRAEFEAGVEVRVLDNVIAVFSGVSVAGGKESKCSEPVAYGEDSLAPRTRITMGPAAKTAKRKAIFRFVDTTGDVPGTAFQCRIGKGKAKGKWKKCSSPLRLKKLRPRAYVVRVKAVDPAGNVETKGAKRRFKVVPRS